MRIIFLTTGGSHLYGNNHADSDFDVRGVFANTADELYGLGAAPRTWTDARVLNEFGIVSDDFHASSLQQFCMLAMNGNPNVLELLFAPVDKWLKYSPEWWSFYQARHKFISKRMVRPHLGYAMASLERLKNKASPQKEKRREMIEKFGYDVKDAGHTLRLLWQLQDVLHDGDFSPVLTPERKRVIDAVRDGAYSIHEFIECANRIANVTRRMESGSTIPKEPDVDVIVRLVYDYYKNAER